MADGTPIEWTEATWNPITGCSVHSGGCKRCYAMLLAGTRMQNHWSRIGLTQETKAGPVWTGEVRFNEEWLHQPLAWKRPRLIFVVAHGDLFHESVPDEWIDRVFAVMALAPQHTFQVLTKRSARMRAYLNARNGMGNAAICRAVNLVANHLGNRRGALQMPLPNVWLGVSVEDQDAADERVPDLTSTPAARRWISAEPLLGPLNLRELPSTVGGIERPLLRFDALTGTHSCGPAAFAQDEAAINWVVTGGESDRGGRARPMHPEWAKSLRDQCAAAGAPFLFKQWGDWAPISHMSEELIDSCYHPAPARDPEASRRCKVGHLVMHADGRIFPMDAWNRLSGENPAAGDFAFATGSGAMTMMQVGKAKAGRLLDGVQHDGMPL